MDWLKAAFDFRSPVFWVGAAAGFAAGAFLV